MHHFVENFSAILHGTLLASLHRMVDCLPNLLSAIFILLIGWALALLISRVVGRLLVSLRLDQLVQSRGLTSTLADVGIDIPLSTIARTFTFWLLLLLTLEPLTEALKLSYLSRIVARLLGMILSVLAAAVILILGLHSHV